jgi:group I intron endonuclease
MIVYKITNIFDGMSYIGQTVKTLHQRWIQHISEVVNGSSNYFHNAIRKYGPDSFIHEVLHICETKGEMDFVEIFYISLLDTKSPNGYNLTDGGEGVPGWIPSNEWRKKKSISMMNNSYSRGKICSPETKKKLHDAGIRIGISPVIREKMNKSHKGHIVTSETRKKISETLKNRKKIRG